ncbi:indolepyruvate oxidoreductase subunit beta [Methanococcoides burtonii]|uniref:Indolepyruvate ferredoxin oxidoreductase subunit beta n=1 Tax=Methanococcoides burtonii (strain DSM 6242 / NBRC 107633 / OCM 468 / ACE-M) TaxID=259564 RepID=Q12XV4_METBU|nr:indolepyruvate oxidoreductase subunit beta [Methanococcoides burtonii]ABE51722.1 Indolepyruvate ferredoxin oxidoreductase subunit beta [Methanococcoides burtonii DSM 6242]
MKFDIIIAGVGGQGVVLASRLLATAAMNASFHVTTAETIGMAQREGSVTSHVRIGDEVCGSLIPSGNADLIIGLEPAETARNLHFLGNGGSIIVNEHAVMPSVNGSVKYDPEQVLEFLKANCQEIISFDFTQLAKQAGTYRAANVAMLAAVAGTDLLPFTPDDLWNVLEKMVPEKYRDVNRRAFDMAFERVSSIKKPEQ